MANGNGAAGEGLLSLLSRPLESASFRIGGQDILVPAMTLYVLDKCADDIKALSPDMSLTDYCKHVINIVSTILAPDELGAEIEMALRLQKVCSFSEMQGLIRSMGELLSVSGFAPSGEDEATSAANPGTGTLTGLSPNSEQEASAVETPTV